MYNTPIYLYEGMKSQILPFILAPFRESQVTFIYGPYFLTADNSTKFISKLFQNSSEYNSHSQILRIFKFKNFISVSLIIPSTLLEVKTNRKGLKLVLGYLVPLEKLYLYPNLISAYGEIFINLFDNVFALQLLNKGANKFIGMLQNQNNFEIIKEKLSRINLISNKINMLTKKNLPQIFRMCLSLVKFFTWIFLRKKILPKYILANRTLNNYEVITEYLKETENFLRRYHIKEVDFTADEKTLDYFVNVTRCLPINLNNIKRVELDTKNNSIRLY
jgi:hypothetical protein